MVTRRAYIDAARAWVGTPYHHGAELVGEGVDCKGVIAAPARRIGYPFIDVTTYSRTATGFALVDMVARWADPVEVGCQQPGDIGIFWVDASKRPQHLAVFSDYRGGLGMIHAWEQAGRRTTPRRRRGIGESTNLGSVVEQAFDRFWAARLLRVFQLRGVDPWQP